MIGLMQSCSGRLEATLKVLPGSTTGVLRSGRRSSLCRTLPPKATSLILQCVLSPGASSYVRCACGHPGKALQHSCMFWSDYSELSQEPGAMYAAPMAMQARQLAHQWCVSPPVGFIFIYVCVCVLLADCLAVAGAWSHVCCADGHPGKAIGSAVVCHHQWEMCVCALLSLRICRRIRSCCAKHFLRYAGACSTFGILHATKLLPKVGRED